MRTYKMNSGVTITYPDELCFVFNPQIIRVSGGILIGEVRLETSIFEIVEGEESYRYRDVRSRHSNYNLSLDISSYLQSLFSVHKVESLQSKKVKVRILHNIGGVFDFTITCIWGAINVGEVFNPSRTVTMFRKFPFTISFYSNGRILTRDEDTKYIVRKVDEGLVNIDFWEIFHNAKSLGMIKMFNTEVFSTFEYSFDKTFKPVSDGTIFIKVLFNDCDKGIYLRWIDRHGFLQYWLFQEGTSTEQSANNGEKLNVEYSDEGYGYYGINRYQGKTTQITRKACATLIDKETFRMLSTIHSSPIVDMYVEGSWVPVNIAAGSFTDTGAELQDFEIQITMPKIITQML